MEKLQILILEDNLEESKEIVSVLQVNGYEVELVNTLEKARKCVKTKTYDVIILDIIIEGKPEGIYFAKEINDLGIKTPFLFLTSMRSKAIFDEAKYTRPLNYLLKPYNDLELLYAVELAVESIAKEKPTQLTGKSVILGTDFLFVKTHDVIKKVTIDAIHCIEVEGKYSKLSTSDGDFLIKLSLTKIKEQLPSDKFSQVHRNYIINLKQIQEIYLQDNLILLECGNSIPFSERYKSQFLKENTIFK